MCESAKCGFDPMHSLTEADKTELREVRRRLITIIQLTDDLVLSDANRSTITLFLSRQLQLVVNDLKR